MPVPGITSNPALLGQSVECVPERIAAQTETPDQGDELRSFRTVELSQDGNRPTVVEQDHQPSRLLVLHPVILS